MDDFYASLPKLSTFEGILDRAAYRALPDGWLIGLADVVSSTAAVADGRYKAVNMAGVAVISALANAKGTLDFPYVFTGDGMACAVPPDEGDLLEETLSTSVAWVGAALDLALRGAVVSVREIREKGHDVRIARFMHSPRVSTAMFAGGGLAWVESALKAGTLPPMRTREGRPDLSGLSCRFRPIASRQGVILSMIVAPTRPLPDEPFHSLVDELLAMTAAGHPVPADGPSWGYPPAGLALEARLNGRSGRPAILAILNLGLRTLVAAIVVKLGVRVGAFVPQRYRAEIAQNSDFRKFGDGLMMTVDCSPALADAIEARLEQADADGAAVSGTHRQDAALMTCVVPSPSHPSHIHFIDGAGGGYTVAARRLKDRRTHGAALTNPSPSPAGAGP